MTYKRHVRACTFKFSFPEDQVVFWPRITMSNNPVSTYRPACPAKGDNTWAPFPRPPALTPARKPALGDATLLLRALPMQWLHTGKQERLQNKRLQRHHRIVNSHKRRNAARGPCSGPPGLSRRRARLRRCSLPRSAALPAASRPAPPSVLHTPHAGSLR